MREYTQITFDERIKIAQYRKNGHSITEISRLLMRSKSTISRELRRNEAPPGEYWPDTANHLAALRCKRQSRLARCKQLQIYVIDKIKHDGWTPEQIAGALKYRQTKLPSVSHESIYKWIYHKDQMGQKLWDFLPRHKKKRGLRKSQGAGKARIPNRVSIHERPFSMKNKRLFGHWEGDLMSFCKNSQHMLVLRERKTMFTMITPLPSKKSIDTALRMAIKLHKIPQKARKTLTLDNGGEFAKHEYCSQNLNGLKVFFCDPYASWQKGGIENTNGRLRRDLPRKTDLKLLNKGKFDEIINNYNRTPRKNLKWLTPLEAFNKNLKIVALHS